MEHHLILQAGIVIAAGALTVLGIAVTLPWLRQHALAMPEKRSSHREPTPQGGGLAVIFATLVIAWLAFGLFAPVLGRELWTFSTLTAAAVLLAVIGFLDDMRNVPALVRLIAQCVAVGMVIAILPEDLRFVPIMPVLAERLCILVLAVWFINAVNFMDGIDWITVAEVIPITGALVVIGVLGITSKLEQLVALALLGAMLGFAPFNRPVARLFLGDVGSQPIGLLLGWLLLGLAVRGHVAAALLLPLYYLADATLTLIRRVVQGEPFWQAHRTHFYQRAIDGGFTVRQVVARVFGTNIGLAILALVSIHATRLDISLGALAAGIVLIAILLWTFARGRK